MKQSLRHLVLMTALATLGMGSLSHAWAAGDAAQGEQRFAEECSDCHSVMEGKNKKGPSLWNIVGRQSASISSFAKYSDGMKQSKIVWTEDKIDAYITHPRKVVPGGKMKYDGMDDAQVRADIIAYLGTLH